MRQNRLLFDWLIIAIGATLLVAGLALTGLTSRADNLVSDRLLSSRAPTPSDQIIVISIDNRSLQMLGKWPWPRTVHAQLLSQLAKAHPRAIAYDVLFTEPARPQDDDALARAMRSAAPVIAPLLYNGSTIIMPVAAVRQAANIGTATVHIDDDGLVRGANLSVNINGHNWPHMMCLMTVCPKVDGLPIAFQPQPGAFRTASFVDVMNGQVPDIFFRDKLVLIGATGDNMDQFPVPIRGGGQMPGIDLQANLLNTLLSGQQIWQVPRWLVALAALAPLWWLMIGFWRWRPRTVIYAALALMIGWMAGTALLFIFAGWWVPPLPALIGLALVIPLWGWRRLAALSAEIEREVAPHIRTAPRFARSDQIETQLTAFSAAMQHSRDLEQSARNREEALQMLSHDMRAPQASIITLLEAEGKGMTTGLATRLTGYARRTLELADNFVQLARIDTAPFAPQEVNVCDVLHEAVDELYPLCAVRQIRMSADGPEEPCYINAEPGLLIRAFLNLLDNAIKYSPNGGAITCSVKRLNAEVVCTVIDQGQGMNEAQRAALFEKFGVIGKRRSAGSAGSGLGLALVKAAMDRHGGRIECESALGKGTRFILSFPAVD